MRHYLILVFTLPLLAQAKTEQVPIAVLLAIPGGFSATPAVDTDQGGVKTRVWSVRKRTLEQSPNLIQFQSMPLSPGETMDLVYLPKKKEFERCKVQEKEGSEPILAKGMLATDGVTKEKILHFSCKSTGKMGVYRFIEGTGKYGDALYIIAYQSKTRSSHSQTSQTMEQVLRNMKVVVASDFAM